MGNKKYTKDSKTVVQKTFFAQASFLSFTHDPLSNTLTIKNSCGDKPLVVPLGTGEATNDYNDLINKPWEWKSDPFAKWVELSADAGEVGTNTALSCEGLYVKGEQFGTDAGIHLNENSTNWDIIFKESTGKNYIRNLDQEFDDGSPFICDGVYGLDYPNSYLLNIVKDANNVPSRNWLKVSDIGPMLTDLPNVTRINDGSHGRILLTDSLVQIEHDGSEASASQSFFSLDGDSGVLMKFESTGSTHSIEVNANGCYADGKKISTTEIYSFDPTNLQSIINSLSMGKMYAVSCVLSPRANAWAIVNQLSYNSTNARWEFNIIMLDGTMTSSTALVGDLISAGAIGTISTLSDDAMKWFITKKN